jgi:hypothetical protein
MQLTMNRRSFLSGVGALSIVGLLEACTGGGKGTSSSRSGAAGEDAAGDAVDDVLRLLQQAVRASPDHLASQAERTVASRDADAIVHFVRDNISVHPHRVNLAAESDRRWGSSATLRAGTGTPRDRVELLAQLLRAAGFTATVMAAARPADITIDALYRPRHLAFAPDEKLMAKAADAARAAGMVVPDAAAASEQSSATTVNDEVETLATAIVNALPPGAIDQIIQRSDLLPDRLPVVRYEVDGQSRYSFAVGDLDPTSAAPADARPLDAQALADKVTVTVKGVFNPPAGSRTPRAELVDLVSATWPLAEVIGRPISVTFDAVGAPADIVHAGLGAMPIRVPSLRLQLPRADAPARSMLGADAAAGTPDLALAAHGNPISILGDLLPPADADSTQVAGPFGPLIGLTGGALTAARARVRTIEVAANASAFPDITLDVAVKDEAGAQVDGLDAASFVVTDSGAAIPAVLLSNGADTRRPRVLVVYDGSGSVHDAFPDDAARLAFNRTIADALVAASGSQPFDVQVTTVGGTPKADDWSAPLADKIVPSFDAFGFSELWRSLAAGGLVGGASVMVLVSDNVSGDDPSTIAALQTQTQAHSVPVVCVPVGLVDEAVTAQIIQLTGGARVDPLAPDLAAQLTSAIDGHLAVAAVTHHRLRYRAPVDGADPRTVTVALVGPSQISAGATYRVPPTDERLAPTSVVGVYVTIDVAGTSDIRRLGGLALGAGGRPIDVAADAAAAADAVSVLNGLTTIAIEAATPTAAAVTDDMLAAHISFGALRPLLPAADIDEITKVAGDLRRYPGLLASVFAPAAGLGAPDGEPRLPSTATRDVTVVVLSQRPDPVALGAETLLTTVDISPLLNTVGSVASDRTVALRDGVQGSLLLSAGEGLVSDQSAHALLVGRAVTYLPLGQSAPDSALAGLGPADAAILRAALDRSASLHRLIPSTGALDAFWVVDPRTGTTLAIAADGSGGARVLLEKSDLYTALNIALLVLGLGCTLGADAAKGPAFYFTCVGLTVASIGLTAAGVFPGVSSVNSGTSFGTFATVLGATVPASKALPSVTLGGRIGVALVVMILFLISAETE